MTMTYDEWKAELDKIADAHNMTPKPNPPPHEVETWTKLYDAGHTPQQAWDLVPFKRNGGMAC